MPEALKRLTAALADRYRLERELGAGGMATVYLAEDLKHHRQVAVKVLHPELAASLGSERFLREITIAANLQHPHILPLYDSGQADGFLYYVMPYVNGPSLRQKLNREGELPIPDAVRILRDVSDAMAHAHQHGVVHRDIKPENVMLSGRHALVADFGIAKALASGQRPEGIDSRRGGGQSTSAGVALGTPAYMAPEQAAAEPHTDHRADIYSFGVLAYELLTGSPPFVAPSAQALLAAHLTAEPEPIRKYRSGIPETLAALVMRCLAKRPADRWQTADELVSRLEEFLSPSGGVTPTSTQPIRVDHGGPTGTATTLPSIAVLPFTDMSPGRDQDWFCEGVAEEILVALAKVPGLRVATRTSAFRFKDPARDIAKIGAALGVTTLLEGSVRTAGSRLRVTAQLVNASDGYELWSERFEGQLADVFDFQDVIAQQIVQALEVRLSPAAVAVPPSSAARHSDDFEAYQCYLKGRYHRYTKLDLRSALRCFEQAVERDPGYAIARVALAEAFLAHGFYGMLPPSQAQARVREELHQARALAGDSAQASAIEGGLALLYDWDTNRSVVAFERALPLDPANVVGRAWYSWTLVERGQLAEAADQIRRILALDLGSAYTNAMAGLTYTLLGRAEEALAHERRAVAIEPGSIQANWMLGLALAAAFQIDEALEWFERAVTLSSRLPVYLGMLAWCQAASGQRDAARRSLAELEQRSASEYVSPLFLAWGYSELGELEQTRFLLDHVIAERSGMAVLMQMPFFRHLRALPPMVELRQRLLGARAMEP